jgi:hypothetical protein
MVYFPRRPFFVVDYTLINTSTVSPLNDVSLYWLMDLDIEGKESYKDDYAEYEEKKDVVIQYHKNGVHAGFCSTVKSSKYECNSPYAIRIKSPQHLNLSNIGTRGPEDCALGLQWDFEQLMPQEQINLPIVFAAGMNETNFYSNMELGISLLKQIKSTDDPLL